MEPKVKKETKQETKTQTKVQEETQVNPFVFLKTKQETAFATALEFGMLNAQEKLLKARKESLRMPVEELVTGQGVETPEGHRVISDDYVEITLQRKTSPSFNSVMAEEILKKKGLMETCSVTQVIETVTLDEDKIREAYEAGLITAQELDEMFTEKVSTALIVKVSAENVPEYKTLNDIRKKIEKENKACSRK